MIRVLLIDGVGPFGGASRSLYEALRAMPRDEVDVRFLAVRGTVVPLYSDVSTDLIATSGLTRFDNTRYSHYRGIRWIVLLRELSHLPFTIAAIVKARWRWRHVDLIHANEITELIPGLLARWVFRAPLVVHVRSLQRVEARSLRCRWIAHTLRADVDAIVAIDENVRATLPRDVKVDVVHNSFTPKVSASADPILLRRLADLRPGSLKVGFVGNLHRSKGIFDLLAAAEILRDSGKDVEFVIVGGATRSDVGVRRWLLRRLGLEQDVGARVGEQIAARGLGVNVHLLGATSDIQRVYERIDVLCFPSHFDAPGRPVFEAAFSGVPSITAVTTPREDTLVDGETGLAVPGEDPVRLAAAIGYFADNRSEISRMGANAKALAERNFDPRRNAEKLLAVYSGVLRQLAPTALQSHPRPQ
jgi:glycosyltransferase involved in cell wall biosynthesis